MQEVHAAAEVQRVGLRHVRVFLREQAPFIYGHEQERDRAGSISRGAKRHLVELRVCRRGHPAKQTRNKPGETLINTATIPYDLNLERTAARFAPVIGWQSTSKMHNSLTTQRCRVFFVFLTDV